LAATIQPDEIAPVCVHRPDGASPFLLTGDHAGKRVPRSLGALGLPQEELDRHIGHDIGVEAVGLRLADRLDATFLWQPYSRLVIDCNRRPCQADSIPEVSDGTVVPGNRALDPADREARRLAIFEPYHARIAAEIDHRLTERRPAILVALHSFTPRHGDFPAPRPWHVGILWNRDDRLARPLAARLAAERGLRVGRNEPYVVSDELDYAIPVHGEARGLVSVEIEMRQDLIADTAGQRDWADRLARVLPEAWSDAQAGNAAEDALGGT
jgi:predicted N-formylglutamate amidohydrolase